MKKNIIIYEGWDREKIIPKITDSGIDNETAKIVFELFDPSFFRYYSGEAETLRFVGVFSVKYNDCVYSFCCFPKYMMERKDAKVSEIEVILKAIEFSKLNYDVPGFMPFNETKSNSEKKKIDLFGLARWILRDYLNNGIINIKSKRTSFKKRGYSDWGKTVSRCIPVTDGENFVYPNIYHTYYESDNELLISRIHSCVVAEVISSLQDLGEANIKPPEHDSALLGKLEQYSAFIQKMLNRLYEDRQVHIMRAVLAWCEEYSRFYDKPVGTVSFELVWERCLRFVFDNVSYNRIKGDFEFDRPIYHIDGHEYEADSNGIPDIININKDSKAFLLLDAKYYLGIISGNKIKEVPTYKDISKQMYYFDMLCDYGLSADTSINAFVFPLHKIGDMEAVLNEGKWFRYIGYVNYSDEKENILLKRFGLEKKSDNRMNKGIILLLQVNPKYLFELIALGDSNDFQKQIKELWDEALSQKSLIKEQTAPLKDSERCENTSVREALTV